MVFTDNSEEPRKSIFRIEEETNRAVSFRLLVTTTHYHNAEYRNATTHYHNAEYRNVNPKVLPYFLLRFRTVVSSLGIIDRYSDNLQTRRYCFRHHLIFSTKACVLTVVQNLVVKKTTSSPMFRGRFSSHDPIIFVVSHAESLPRFCCCCCCYCFVFEMLLYFLQGVLTLRCKYSGTKSHKCKSVNYLQ
jgi:hypothetical protein